MAYNKEADCPETAFRYKKKQSDRRGAERDLSLRSFFMLTVFGTFCIVVLFSGLVIAGCAAFRHYLLPDANAAYLTVEHTLEDGSTTSSSHLLNFGEASKLPMIVTESVDSVREEDSGTLRVQTEITEEPDALRIKTDEFMLDATYSIQKLESSYDTLTPKRKLAYRFCGAAMIIVPAVLSIAGILFCGFYFYRKRLSVPLGLLADATEAIAAQNLDFSLEYKCGDEMGALCRSFELMRRELAENQKAMWNMLEQRRLMQASIAHDLRNPIAIIQGYTEYLLLHLPAGNISREKAGRIAGNLNLAAKRLEQYTESVRTLNQLEDMEIHRKEISVKELIADIRDDLEVMADSAGLALHINTVFTEKDSNMAGNAVPGNTSQAGITTAAGEILPHDCTKTDDETWDMVIKADTVILHRILENVFENATRFAQNTISVEFMLRGHMLQITVTDDGKGFSDEILRRRQKNLLPTQQEGHLGMGLAISRVLCEKHGGSMQLKNAAPHGGIVRIQLLTD
ncbi:MAG TPA: hypothetical protein DCZ91_23810 [Lachnospiraceae bacterium]|nr:hypothetical protein [Lachnospiraceae bacterium]